MRWISRFKGHIDTRPLGIECLWEELIPFYEPVVLIHIALVSLGPLLKKLGEPDGDRRPAAAVGDA